MFETPSDIMRASTGGRSLRDEGEILVVEVIMNGYETNHAQSLVKLNDGKTAILHSDHVYQGESRDYHGYNLLRGIDNLEFADLVGLRWGWNACVEMIFADGDEVYSQEFLDPRTGVYQPLGDLNVLDKTQVYELEYQLDVDLNEDGEYGQPRLFVQDVILNGVDTNFGHSVVKLSDGTHAMLYSSQSYVGEDTFLHDGYEALIGIEQLNFDDLSGLLWSHDSLPTMVFVDREGIVTTQKLKGNSSINYDNLQVHGNQNILEEVEIYEIELQIDVDLNDDGDIGEPKVLIESVILNGYETNFEQSIVELSSGETAMVLTGEAYVDDYADDYGYAILKGIESLPLDDLVGLTWGDRGPKMILIM